MKPAAQHSFADTRSAALTAAPTGAQPLPNRIGPLRKLIYVAKHFTWVLRHPLNRPDPLRTLGRYFGWHLGCRLLRHPIAVPYANGLRMLVQKGGNAVGTVHFGFDEYWEQAFCAHLLREGDLFVDVGASEGSYVLLASGVAGARTIAYEPEPMTADRLSDNIALNRLDGRVELRRRAVGASSGAVAFTTHLRTSNHVVDADAAPMAATVSVPCTTLDADLAGSCPCMLKIDVEGHESAVIDGGEHVLRDQDLLAVLLEDMQLGRGADQEGSLHRRMLALGFRSFTYDPRARRLIDLDQRSNLGGLNTLYLRNIDAVVQRVATAPPIRIRDQLI